MAAARAQRAPPCVLKQGYLLKLSSSLVGDWKRRFFVLDSRGVLSYYADAESARSRLLRLAGTASAPAAGAPKATVPLLTATVKRDAGEGAPQLRFTFRLVSPLRTLTLQAEGGAEQAEWVEAISGAIAELLNTHQLGGGEEEGGLSDVGSEGGLEEAGGAGPALLRPAGNDACADCGAPAPDWASLNLTALLCLRCSGAHRALGVACSKVRSTTLDVRAWEDGATLAAFAAGGNARLNAVLEALPAAAEARPPAGAPPEALAAFVHAKYVQRAWCAPEAQRRAARRLQKACNGEGSGGGAGGDALAALLAGASAQGAAQGPPGSPPPGAPPRRALLHAAAEGGRLACCELLLQWGAPHSPRDEVGDTPLLLAARAAAAGAPGAAEVARLLLRRGAVEQLEEAVAAAGAADGRLLVALQHAAMQYAAVSAAAAAGASAAPSPALERGAHRRLGSGDLSGLAGSLGRIFRPNALVDSAVSPSGGSVADVPRRTRSATPKLGSQ